MNSSATTVTRCVHDVTAAITELLADRVAFPRTAEAMQRNAAGFYARGARRAHHNPQGLLHVIGAIDGTHVLIKNPKEGDPKYINRKKSKSVNVQAVCDHRGLFIDVYTGEPGRTHDSKAFKRSPLYAALSGVRDLPASQVCRDMWDRGLNVDGVHVPYCLVADSAYACEAFVLPAFKDSIAQRDRERRRFNSKHSSTRSVVEGAFGRLKTRWRVLLRQNELVSMTVINNVITACFILHNICETEGEPVPDVDDQLLADLREHAAGMGAPVPDNEQPALPPMDAGRDAQQADIQAYAALCRQYRARQPPPLPAATQRAAAGTDARQAMIDLVNQ
jgi:hypothetical protein